MFSILHKASHGETLYHAKTVTHLPKGADDKPAVMFADPYSGKVEQIVGGGTCYVMNETGATVATYPLG